MKKLFVVLILLLLYFSNLFSVYHKVGELFTNGNYQEIEISENLAFVSDEDFGLRIYEINDPSSPTLIGSLELDESVDDILIIDNLAYLLSYDAKLYIVNIQNPFSPILLGEYTTNRSCHNFSINNRFAYIIEVNDRLEVVYIGNPENPVFVSEFTLTNQGIGCAVTNNLAFVATYSGLFVYDISNPYELNQINWFNTGNTHSPLIYDDLLFFSGTDGLEIIDYSDPSNLQVLSSNDDIHFYDCKIVEDKLYGAYGYKIHGVDISNLQTTELIQTYFSNVYCSKIAVKDNFVFTNAYYDGFNIIDVTNPQNPELLGCLDVRANKIAKSPDDEFMLVYGRSYNGLNFFKMDDPLNPEFLYSHISHGGQWGCKAFYIDNEIACSVFGTVENAKFYLYDLSNLEFLTIPGIINLNYYISNFNITSIDRKDNYVYLGTSTDGLIVIDISDPENPVHIFNFYINGFIFNLTIKDDYLYFVNIGGLRIFDISNPLCPIDIGYWNSHNRAEAFALLENYAYVADYDGGVKVIDISDPTNPILVNTLILNYNSKLTVQPIIISNKLFISDKDWNEIFIYDLTDPANPFFQSSYKWNKYSNDMEIFNNYLYSANGAGAYHNYGLSILDFSEFITKTLHNEIQITPLNLSNYPNPFNPSTTISFNLQEEGEIKLEIYNIKGQKVRAFNLFPNGSLGTREVIWNGTDENNQPVSSGIYFYKLNVNGKTEAVKKCLLLK